MINEKNISFEAAKRVYNWFHHAFPDYKNNELCTSEDIELRNNLEMWILANE